MDASLDSSGIWSARVVGVIGMRILDWEAQRTADTSKTGLQTKKVAAGWAFEESSSEGCGS